MISSSVPTAPTTRLRTESVGVLAMPLIPTKSSSYLNKLAVGLLITISRLSRALRFFLLMILMSTLLLLSAIQRNDLSEQSLLPSEFNPSLCRSVWGRLFFCRFQLFHTRRYIGLFHTNSPDVALCFNTIESTNNWYVDFYVLSFSVLPGCLYSSQFKPPILPV